MIGLFLVALCHSTAWGASTFAIEPQDGTYPVASIFQVEVQLSTTENVSSFQFTIEYDESMMQFESAALGPPFSVTNL